jgi:hypothetical protein
MFTINGDGPMSELPKTCPCSSGKERRELIDARGILCAFVCDDCEARKRRTFRPEVLTDANYDHDEPLNEIAHPLQLLSENKS